MVRLFSKYLFLHHVEVQAALLLFHILIEGREQDRVALAHRPPQDRGLDAEGRLEPEAVGELHVEQVGIAQGDVVCALVDAGEDLLGLEGVGDQGDREADGILESLQSCIEGGAWAHVDGAPGQVPETGDGIHIGAHHHQLVHLVVGPGKDRLGLTLRGDGHGRGHQVPLAFVQVGQQVGVAVGDDDVEPQAVTLGESLHQRVFEAHLPAAVYEVGQRVVARDHAQPAALLQSGQVVGEGFL